MTSMSAWKLYDYLPSGNGYKCRLSMHQLKKPFELVQKDILAGVRWDFVRNLDFKLQLQQVTILSLDDPASFANIQPGARVGDKANVLSLALDFVF